MTARPPAGAPFTKQTIIKMYADRRLYNSRNGQYVSRKTLEEMARKGEDFEVVGTKTGEGIYAFGPWARSLWRRRLYKRSRCCRVSSCGGC
jgi:hypothetical protein